MSGDIPDEWVEKAHRVYLESGAMTLTQSRTREMLAAVAEDIRAQERDRLMGIRVPVNGEPGGSISLAEFEIAYVPYGRRYSQSAERVCERGGFGWNELTQQLGHEPETWRPMPGDRNAYKTQRRIARAEEVGK